MRTLVAGLVAGLLAAVPAAAAARPTASLDGGTVVFFSDTLIVIARDGATLHLADGTTGTADAACVDLRADRIVLAGHAQLAHGAAHAQADAIALELTGDRVDLLDAATGVARTTRALGPAVPAEIDAQRFAFPDVNDRNAFIRSRHATITPHADVRFRPAAFPTSVGGLPVPSYLYTFASGAGFGATSLPGASFDQPYGLWGSPTSLTALHARWEDPWGPALGVQQSVVSGDDGYATAAFDQPFRGYSTHGFDAYRRLGRDYTVVADVSGTIYGTVEHAGATAAFGLYGARADYSRNTAGGSTFDASIHTPDRPLFGGATWRLKADVGFDAQRGGLLYELPDAREYSLVWRHGLDFSVATPVVHLPLKTQLAMNFDASRTWYAFPHHYDALSASATASRQLSRKLRLFAGYQEAWSAQVYPGLQQLFYPVPTIPILTPDGTPYYGYDAFTGASVLRAVNLDVQYTPTSTSAIHLTVVHTDDFPQFNGYGRPQWQAGADVRIHPFANFGIDVGRYYDFAWGGTRWVPQWSFAITP